MTRAYLAEAKYESLRMLRSPAFGVPFLGLPVGLYLLFAVLLYGDATARDPKIALYLFMGLAVFGAMGPGLFGFGITVAMERERGLLRLKRAMPVPPAAPLLAKMLMSMLFVALVQATMIAASRYGHVRLGAAQLAGAAAVNVLGSLPFCALGFFIGSLAAAKAAPAFVNLIYLPMIYLSGILFPLPASVQWIARYSPAYHLNQAALGIIGAPAEGALIFHVAALAVVTLAFTTLAARRLSRVS